MSSQHLNEAKSRRYDEFYTQLSDVESELDHYSPHFAGRIVYCPADDPRRSAFVEYFTSNFDRLKLRRLVASCYVDQQMTLDGGLPDRAVKAVWPPGTVTSLNSDGDFRGGEAVGLLRQADIVVTNPPFSLFIDLIRQLTEHDKKFLIVGHVNAAAYVDVFPLLQTGRVRVGYHRGAMRFRVPDDYPSVSTKSDAAGRKWQTVGNICWWTNLPVVPPPPLSFTADYNSAIHVPYENFTAVEVPTVKTIPRDYGGVMGVPVTFLYHWCPAEFELVGATVIGLENGYRVGPWKGHALIRDPAGNLKAVFKRLLIRRVN